MELDVGIIEGKVQSRDLVAIPMIDDYLVLVCGKEDVYKRQEKRVKQVFHLQFL